MSKKIIRKDLIFYFLTVIIFTFGIFFWLSDLKSDPPMYYSGLGQSLSTDPAQYVYHARNKVLFDDFDPFDYPRWTIYQHSLTSLTAYIWFSAAGVSVTKANIVGIILCLGSLVFFILGLVPYHKPWVSAAVAFCYLINVTLITYGRLSYLENGLLFISSLLFFVYSRWHNKVWGVLISGVLVALAMLTGKLFGALLMPALFFAILFSNNKQRWQYSIISLSSFIVAAVLLSLLLYGKDLTAAFGYIGEQSYGLRGFPVGLSTPWDFVEHLISFGQSNRLFFLNPDLVVFLLLSSIILTYYFCTPKNKHQFSPVIVFSSFWIITVFIGLMPLNYSPLRYALFLIPPIIILLFSLLDEISNMKIQTITLTGYVKFIFLFIILWHSLYQIICLFFFVNNPPIRLLTWAVFPVAIIITFTIRLLFIRQKILLSKRFVKICLSLTIILALSVNIFRIDERLLMTTNFNIIEANEDLALIVNHNAVISGSYGPVLTMNNGLKSFIHLFGVARIDSSLFNRYPITHLAVDVSNWDEAVENYPALKNLPPITTYWIRDYEVKIYNISAQHNNSLANKYESTFYEKAAEYYYQKKWDSAYVELTKFIQIEPDSKSANLMLAELLFMLGKHQDVMTILTSMTDRYPTDFYINLQCGRLFQILSIIRKDNYLLNLANRYYEKAVKANPFKANYAKNVFQQTMQQLKVSNP
ncbi:MAG: hypothetical protein ACE5D6_04360 [Candidatus Zixiibacteriota bacterium]